MVQAWYVVSFQMYIKVTKNEGCTEKVVPRVGN